MARDDPQVNFRIPAGLKARLEEAAFGSGNSLTAEIVARLTASFPANAWQELLETRMKQLEAARALQVVTSEELRMYWNKLKMSAGDYAGIDTLPIEDQQRLRMLERELNTVNRSVYQLTQDIAKIGRDIDFSEPQAPAPPAHDD